LDGLDQWIEQKQTQEQQSPEEQVQAMIRMNLDLLDSGQYDELVHNFFYINKDNLFLKEYGSTMDEVVKNLENNFKGNITESRKMLSPLLDIKPEIKRDNNLAILYNEEMRSYFVFERIEDNWYFIGAEDDYNTIKLMSTIQEQRTMKKEIRESIDYSLRLFNQGKYEKFVDSLFNYKAQQEFESSLDRSRTSKTEFTQKRSSFINFFKSGTKNTKKYILIFQNFLKTEPEFRENKAKLNDGKGVEFYFIKQGDKWYAIMD